MPSEERIQCQVLSYFSVTLSFSRLISSAEKRYFVTLLMILCSVPTELGASGLVAVFTKSFCAWPPSQTSVCQGASDRPQPPDGLSNQPVAKVSNHALLVFSCHSRAARVVYRIRINQLESLLLLSSLAFKLIKLPTKYSLNFKASCWALVRSSHERDTQSQRCDTED